MLMSLAKCILAIAFVVAGITAQKMLGAGKWSVLSLSRCENDDEMPWKVDVRRHRLNRTHEALSADIKLESALDDTYGMQIDACKKMDGGCKPYMTIQDNCLPTFVKKHAEDNVRCALSSAGLDPPDFPIPAGEYHIKDFIVNTDDLPKDGLYGEYGISCFVMKEGVKKACVAGNVRYDPEEDGFSSFG